MTAVEQMPYVEATNHALVAHHDPDTDVTLFWFEETVADLGFDPTQTPSPVTDPQPWDMSKWDTDPPLKDLIRELAMKASGGVDVTDFLYMQQDLVWFIAAQDEKKWRNNATQKDHPAEPGGSTGRHDADLGGSRRDDPGRRENSDTVGETVA